MKFDELTQSFAEALWRKTFYRSSLKDLKSLKELHLSYSRVIDIPPLGTIFVRYPNKSLANNVSDERAFRKHIVTDIAISLCFESLIFSSLYNDLHYYKVYLSEEMSMSLRRRLLLQREGRIREERRKILNAFLELGRIYASRVKLWKVGSDEFLFDIDGDLLLLSIKSEKK
jgi:hypothetical protein